MRLAAGISVERVAHDMDFTRKMLFQMERSEQKQTISLERPGKMVRALEAFQEIAEEWSFGSYADSILKRLRNECTQ